MTSANPPSTNSNDAAYADAVKRCDILTAKKMIREAAAKKMPNTKVVGKNGLPRVVYHGSPRGGFNTFKIPMDKEDPEGAGIYFSSSYEVASLYGGYEIYYPGRPSMDVLLSRYASDGTEESLLRGLSLVLGLECELRIYHYVPSEEEKKKYDLRECWTTREIGKESFAFGKKNTKEELLKLIEDTLKEGIEEAKKAKEAEKGKRNPLIYKCFLNLTNPIEIDAKGCDDSVVKRPNGFKAIKDNLDGFIIYNVVEYGSVGIAKDYVAYYPNKIKSAEVTYDDSGILIPLSKRFDFSNPDIRY